MTGTRLSPLILAAVVTLKLFCETSGYHGIPSGLLHHPPNPAFIKADEDEDAELATMKADNTNIGTTSEGSVTFVPDHNTEEVAVGHKVSFGGFPNFELPSESPEPLA
mmetsp:Transcript_26594/g.39172  ORF Transcript_26594/g.39172 Transcript_26594/m.39172 type:complete len:108 (-) Transcript_26594:280-603(-)